MRPIARSPWLLCSLALVAACFDPHPVPGSPCATGDRCPSGLRCVNGFCLDDDTTNACAGQPDGVGCGDVAASDCNQADTCTAGACATNEAPDGSACYDCSAGAGLCASCALGACVASTCSAAAPIAGDLVSAIVANNSDEGNMFDVVATTTITITSFETHANATGTTDYEIWTKQGTHVGAETDRTQWTLVGMAQFTTLGQGVFSPIPIPVNITIAAGERQAFYLTHRSANNRYHNGTAVGAMLASTPELALFEGAGVNYGTDGFTSINAPRAWEGKIHYRSGGGSTLATSMAGTSASNGVMFDVVAAKDLKTTFLAAHLAPGEHAVEVYFKRGSHVGAEASAMQWRQLGAMTQVLSAGANTPTILPFAPVFLEAGSTTAFYVTTSTQLQTTSGTQVGATAASNADLTIAQGVPVTGAFGTAGPAAIPNVELGYGTCAP